MTSTTASAAILMMPAKDVGEAAPRAAGERLIRLPEVLSQVGLSRAKVYEMVKDGEFPGPRKVHHSSLWVESEVQQWIRSVIAPAQ